MTLPEMDWVNMAATIVAFGGIVGTLVKFYVDLKSMRNRQVKLQNEYNQVWYGIVARGEVEARRVGHLIFRDGRYELSIPAQVVFAYIKTRLVSLKNKLEVQYCRIPTDQEFAWAIEQDSELQRWMLDIACPQLGVNQHGCLAIACHLVKNQEPPPIELKP